MKKQLLFVALLFSTLFFACDKDGKDFEPTRERQVLLAKQTGTWCGSCPYAAELYQTLTTEYGTAIIPIAVHGGYDDPMEISSTYVSFRKDRMYNSFPSIYVTEERYSSDYEDVTTAINAKLAEPVEAAIAIKATDLGDSIKIDAKSAFYEDLTGTYYLSIYVTEDNIFGGTGSGDYEQSSGNANYYHNYVLRNTSIEGNFWGEEIIVDPTKDLLLEHSYTIAKSSDWVDANLKYSAALWKFDNSNGRPYFTYVNACSEK